MAVPRRARSRTLVPGHRWIGLLIKLRWRFLFVGFFFSAAASFHVDRTHRCIEVHAPVNTERRCCDGGDVDDEAAAEGRSTIR